MNFETKFMNALQSTKNFEVSAERLLLVDDDSNLLVELVGET